MDAEISQSEQWLRFVAWVEDNWRRVAAVASVLIGVGIIIAFVVWQGGQKQLQASTALSQVLAAPVAPSSAALLAVAEEHGGTEASHRAMLLAAGALFTEGRFAEAQTQFERVLAEQAGGVGTPQARFGVAACKQSQGQVEAAIADYKSIVDNPASGAVIPQARYALGGLYVKQGQPELARVQYEALSKTPGSSLAAEARTLLTELPADTTSRQVEVPALAPAATPPTQP
jgi:predicted negative regulator of RcsB-dependent stress response